MNVAEFKRKNPEHKDVPDKELADSIYEQHYKKRMPREDFMARFLGEDAGDSEEIPAAQQLSVSQGTVKRLEEDLQRRYDEIVELRKELADSRKATSATEAGLRRELEGSRESHTEINIKMAEAEHRLTSTQETVKRLREEVTLRAMEADTARKETLKAQARIERLSKENADKDSHISKLEAKLAIKMVEARVAPTVMHAPAAPAKREKWSGTVSIADSNGRVQQTLRFEPDA